MTCKDCQYWKHDPTNKQDAGMFELGYKPCQLDKDTGRYLHGEARSCENFSKTVLHDEQQPSVAACP